MKKLVLLDGHSILNRAFYGIPNLTISSGFHTNAIYGFLSILFKVIEDEKPDYLAVAFDVKAPTFRHSLYDAYKGTRKGMPEELHEQVPVMKEVLQAMEITTVEQAGLEADDLLGCLSVQGEKAGMNVTIVSGDRDLLQLATEKVKIRLAKPKKGGSENEDYYANDVLEKYGVTPKEFIEVKALMGDTSDNIPGLPGVGEKTATKLIEQYHSIENAYEHREQIKPKKAQTAFENDFELAKLSKVLATIDTGCMEAFDFEQAKLSVLYTPKAYEMFKKLEFKNFLNRFSLQDQLIQAQSKTIERKSALLKNTDDVLAICEKIKGQSVGVAFYQETLEDTIKAIAITDEKETYILRMWEFPFGQLEEYVKQLLFLAGEIRTFSVKDLKRGLLLSNNALTLDNLEKLCYFAVHLAAYLLNPLKNSYSYDDVAYEYLEKNYLSTAEVLGKTKWHVALDQVPESVEKILSFEAEVAFESKEILKKSLQEANMWDLYVNMELPLVDVLLSMEVYGIHAEAPRLKNYSETLGEKIKQLEASIYEQAGEEFNVNSPKQLGDILFEKLQLKGGKKTKTGYSTAADVLEKLAPKAPIVADILEYRQLAKLKSTYADGLVNFIKEDGKIHSNFHQTITATGRISSSDPNLQNIPVRMELGRQIRKVFVPKEGHVFVDADYSQIELRVLAHMSGDERLIDAYKQAEDIHKITASQVFHVPLEEVDSQLRRNAKAVNFGIVYGISSFGLSQDLSISKKEAGAYIEKYFETYPKIKGFLEKLVADAKDSGYSYTMYDRRRPVPELSSSNFMQRSFGERIAMNSPIQGTAADIIKLAMLRVYNALKEKGLKARLILQVHDELLIETPVEEKEQVQVLIKEQMEHAASLLVPLVVDVNTGENWYETK